MEKDSETEKNKLLSDINEALSNEDVLLSLSELHFKSLVDCFLKMFALEKTAQERSQEDIMKENI